MTDTKWVFAFSEGPRDPELLGSKGSGLAEMTAMGLPVPPGFTITTSACSWFFSHGETWPDGLQAQLDRAVSKLESETGRTLGNAKSPLLVSVRSGATASMPGMMDTVLNLGLNDQTVAGIAANAPVFAWDSYCRFIQMFGDVVLGIHYTRFAKAEQAMLQGRERGELSVEELQRLADALKGVVSHYGHEFPQEPREQLRWAIDAVFRSYNSHRARYYRKTNGIPDDAGTAVNIQAMVFGNRGDDSGTGIAFSRNPKSGENALFGEWLTNAQGEDVAAGHRTPWPLNETSLRDGPRLDEQLPEAYATLSEVATRLETHFGDMQEIEFTIDSGTLYLLQTRKAKRTPQAAVKIVVDLVADGVLTEEQGLARIDPRDLELVLRPVISPDAKKKVIARGLDASPGAACGRVVFTTQDVQELYDRDEPAILVRMETNPEDIQGMTVARGVLTARGGQTSHAAVVARGMGKPAVVGCTDIQVDYTRELFYAGDTVVQKGDFITIDGATGDVMEGEVEMLAPGDDAGSMTELLGWADKYARLKVRANADTGADARRARELGAVGIGLCRTEHMFFQPDALKAIRRMILADDPRSRKRALNDILPLQRQMFHDLFREMDGYPVTIRLLDPPLHEFLPERDKDMSDVAEDLGVRPESLLGRLQQLRETNPMLGHRGVRMGITNPEVYETQIRAIFEAACEVSRDGIEVVPEVMIPLVCDDAELERVRSLVIDVAERVLEEYGCPVRYAVGTMIELPRACLLADRLAEHADFFSFGTNDLTQMTFGFSRDDMGKYFPAYQREGILPDSPLSVFDIDGVGELVKIAVERGRGRKDRLQLGICGEHGGDPAGVRFFHDIGLHYVSCSPFRVPVARLAAAHAALGITT